MICSWKDIQYVGGNEKNGKLCTITQKNFSWSQKFNMSKEHFRICKSVNERPLWYFFFGNDAHSLPDLKMKTL